MSDFASSSADVSAPVRPAAGSAERCFACDAPIERYLRGVRDVHAGTGRDYDLAVCDRCGATKMRDVLTDAELAQIYPDDYYSYSPPAGLAGALRKFKRRVVDRPFIPTFRKLLELGCGHGELLQIFTERGSAIGLERSKTPAEHGRAAGLDIVSGDVEDRALFAPGSFDYVYSNHSFEHLTDPNKALDSLYEWLEPGGKLFVAVPNWDGLVPHLFKKNWYYVGPPLHVTNSTPRSMRAILERHGFVVDKIGYKSFPISIAASLAIAAGGSVGNMGRGTKLMVSGLSLLSAPGSLALDLLGMGDCMEVHAHKPA